MSEPGDRIGDRYRELARETPPPALDAAILAASRRAVGAGPIGARKSSLQRWFVPASVAAVLVLGVGVALRMQVEQPGVETSLPAAEYPLPASAETAPPAEVKAEIALDAAAKATSPAEPLPRRVAKERAVAPAPAPAREAAPPERAFVPEPPPAVPSAAARAPVPQAVTPAMTAPLPPSPMAPAAPASAPSNRMAPPPAQGASLRSAPQERREAAADASLPPEGELERIARLREANRHEEADRALAAFHRRFPDHRIPTEMWERVRPR